MSKTGLFKNSAIYSAITLLQKGINFLLIPILTIYLSTYDYGVIALIVSINAFLNVFYLLALPGTLNRFYYEYEGNEIQEKKLFGTIITFVLMNSFFMSLVIILFRKYVLQPFLQEVPFFPFMALGLISVVLNPCYAIYQSSLQARQEGVRFGKNNSAFFVVNISLLLLAVLVFDMGAEGVLGALAITNIVFFGFTLIRFRKDFLFGIDKEILRKSLRYALPIVPHTLSGVATMFIDRILINKLLSTSLVGIYSVGNNFGGIVFLLASGVNQAFLPWFNQQFKKDGKKQIVKAARYLILLYCVVALGLSFFGKEVVALITPEVYHGAWEVIPLIAFAFVYHGVYHFFASALFYDIKGRGNRIIPISTVSVALLNIILNFAMIPSYGIVGAALATLLSKIILVVSLSFFYNKYVDLKYPIKYMLFVPALFFLISLIGYSSFMGNHQLLFKVLLFVLIITGIFQYSKKDLKGLYNFKRFRF